MLNFFFLRGGPGGTQRQKQSRIGPAVPRPATRPPCGRSRACRTPPLPPRPALWPDFHSPSRWPRRRYRGHDGGRRAAVRRGTPRRQRQRAAPRPASQLQDAANVAGRRTNLLEEELRHALSPQVGVLARTRPGPRCQRGWTRAVQQRQPAIVTGHRAFKKAGHRPVHRPICVGTNGPERAPGAGPVAAARCVAPTRGRRSPWRSGSPNAEPITKRDSHPAHAPYVRAGRLPRKGPACQSSAPTGSRAHHHIAG